MFTSSAQDSASHLKFTFYVDAYYAHYTDSVGHGKYEKFGYVSPLNDAFSINIAQLSTQYTSNLVRATITLQYGDIPQAIWSPKFNYLQETFVGIKLFKNFWMDAGFFRSHIGTESLLPRDNICSSQSVISWCEPFYQSGVRFTYTPSSKFTGALYIVNGSNQFVPVNNEKAAGLALTYYITDNLNIIYTNFLSDNTPDSIQMYHWRLWNNLALNWTLSKKIKVQLGGDYVTQEHSDITISPSSITYATAMALGSIVSLKYQCLEKFGIYARYETLYDPQGIITGPDNYYSDNPAYELIGGTFGIEFKPTAKSYLRLEGRELELLGNNENYFYSNGNYGSYRGEVMINTGISF